MRSGNGSELAVVAALVGDAENKDEVVMFLTNFATGEQMEVANKTRAAVLMIQPFPGSRPQALL